MQTQRVSLSRLNEMITETVEARPEHGPNQWGTKYWRVAWPGIDSCVWWPSIDFTADEGAILRLAREKKCRVETALLPGGFCVAAYNPDNPPNQVWAGDAKPPRWYWQEWYGNENTALAPALCCAYLFALSGVRYEIDD